MAIILAEVGNEVFIDGDFEDAINEGVSKAYFDGKLRCSVVAAVSRMLAPAYFSHGLYQASTPGLENFEHYFASVRDEFNCVVV